MRYPLCSTPPKLSSEGKNGRRKKKGKRRLEEGLGGKEEQTTKRLLLLPLLFFYCLFHPVLPLASLNGRNGRGRSLLEENDVRSVDRAREEELFVLRFEVFFSAPPVSFFFCLSPPPSKKKGRNFLSRKKRIFKKRSP